MNKLIRAIRRAPKRSGVVAMLTAVVAIPAMIFAWGPDRPTYTMAHPADHVTFNSITDNPVHGDERNFVQIRNYTDNGAYAENVNLVPGKEYEVYVFYHNNASTNLNDAAHNYKGVALDTTMRVEMPATVAAGADARVTGYVNASNASPKSVWDEAYGKNTSASSVALRYVPNSAVITNNGTINGTHLDLNKLASSTGTLLGYNALDGKVPGCSEYSGFATYRFTVDQPNFEISKQVSVAGQNQFGENVTVKPGETVDYKIKYKNTGTTTQDNVTIKDTLPTGMAYVASTTMYSSSKTNNQWTAANSDKLTTDGINFGSFAPGAALYVKFTAKAAANDQLAKCGDNVLTNTVSANTPNGSKSDTADITVPKTCEPPVKHPAVTIDKKVDGSDGPKEVNVDQIFDYTLLVTNTGDIDLTNVVVTDAAPTGVQFISTDKGSVTDNKLTYTIDTLAVKASQTITIKAKVTAYQAGNIVNTACVDAKEVPGDKDDCDDVTITVKPRDVKVCEIATGTVITVTEEQAKDTTKYAPEDSDKCKKVEVCEIATGNIVTVTKDKANDTTKYAPKDSDKCKVKVCDIASGTVILVPKADATNEKYAPEDSDKCKKVEVCEIATGNIITVTKDAAKDTSKYAPVDSDKCKVEVCDPTTGDIITVDKKDEGKYKPTDDKACNPTPCPIPGKEHLDKDDADCKETPKPPVKCDVPGKEHLNKDDANCKETPEVPVTELPKTGLSELLSGVAGLGAITAASYYYVASRRS